MCQWISTCHSWTAPQTVAALLWANVACAPPKLLESWNESRCNQDLTKWLTDKEKCPLDCNFTSIFYYSNAIYYSNDKVSHLLGYTWMAVFHSTLNATEMHPRFPNGSCFYITMVLIYWNLLQGWEGLLQGLTVKCLSVSKRKTAFNNQEISILLCFVF